MTINELIEALQSQARVMGGNHPVGLFADEFGTWHEITGIQFRPHEPNKWPTCYSPPPGGGFTFECAENGSEGAK